MRATNDSDMRYFWAAYQMGMWREFMEGGLSQVAFREQILEVIALAPHDWVVLAPGKDGNRPIGLVVARSVGAGRGIEPHVDWFPWATDRNKIEGVAAFLSQIGATWKIFVFVSVDAEPFWRRMVQYRILRRGCKVDDHFARGEDAYLYYTMGP